MDGTGTDGFGFPPKPWSQSRMKALRKAILAGDEEVDGLSYTEVYDWYFSALQSIVGAIGNLDLSGLDVHDIRLSSRVKTVDTLRDKLIRIPSMSITSVHDVMGARIAADMSLATQDELVDRLCRLLGTERTEVLDIRSRPHSGYRAVHVILRTGGVSAEIQIRTLLQDLWANCFEEAGDLFGRGIRYDGDPERDDHGLTTLLRGISEGIAALELAEEGPLSMKAAARLTNERGCYERGLRMTAISLKGLRTAHGLQSGIEGE
ncbi:RelA/SpoT domain-containing protein [Bifidobacterium myosotis]|uniref:RelA/SpoT domain-containing protein n=1 Tax=Bifidobacterium myosotis TaxID=1630166 RepID=A0A5M9ZHU6_9BIFI|nr:RelA/SpoT domain-containing protein [Bifidobacterium myosotis]KAA8825372.1 hypothetical protein EMO91_12470 [Bifidobacterium myosotis]